MGETRWPSRAARGCIWAALMIAAWPFGARADFVAYSYQDDNGMTVQTKVNDGDAADKAADANVILTSVSYTARGYKVMGTLIGEGRGTNRVTFFSDLSIVRVGANPNLDGGVLKFEHEFGAFGPPASSLAELHGTLLAGDGTARIANADIGYTARANGLLIGADVKFVRNEGTPFDVDIVLKALPSNKAVTSHAAEIAYTLGADKNEFRVTTGGGGRERVFIRTVPEPSALVSLALGSLAWAGWSRRRTTR